VVNPSSTKANTPKGAKASPDTGAALARYYVDAINGLRSAMGLPALVGVSFGRLGKSMKDLLQGSSGEDIRGLINGLVAHWPIIAASCSWMKPAPAPDEHSIFNSKIMESLRAAMAGPTAQTSSNGRNYDDLF